MSSLIVYLLKVSLCLTVFYVTYHFLFRKSRHFQLNRFYLLYTSIISLFIPLFTFNLTWDSAWESPAFSGVVRPIQVQSLKLEEWVNTAIPIPIVESARFEFSVADLLGYFYLATAVVLALYFLVKLFRLYRAINDSSTDHMHNTLLLRHPGMSNVSFFRFIFIDKDKDDPNFDFILDHELVHARQWHSLDNLIMEILRIVQWYNPVIYLIHRTLQYNHEYIADEAVALSHPGRRNYMQALISESEHAPSPSFMNCFHTGLKDRLTMLHRSQFPKGTSLHYLLALPTLALLFIANNARLSDSDLLSGTTGILSMLNEPLLVYGEQSMLDEEGPTLVWGEEQYPTTWKNTEEASEIPFWSLVTYKLRKSKIDRNQLDLISSENIENISLEMIVNHSRQGSIKSISENIISVPHTFSEKFTNALQDVRDKSSIILRGSIDYNGKIRYLNIDFFVEDPETKENYLRYGSQNFDMTEDHSVAYGEYLPQINQVSYRDLINIIRSDEKKYILNGFEMQIPGISYLEMNGKSAYYSQDDLIERLKNHREIAYPIAITIEYNDKTYFSVFDDEPFPKIDYQNWVEMQTDNIPFLIPSIRTRVKEDISIKWKDLELFSASNDKYLSMLQQWTNFQYRANLDNMRGLHRIRAVCKITVDEARKLFMQGPEIFSDGNRNRKAITMNLRYIDHIGVPFETQLFYDSNRQLVSRENYKQIASTLKPGDFINLYRISVGSEPQYSSEKLPVGQFRFKVVK